MAATQLHRRPDGEIRALVRAVYTGNRARDLAGFTLDEFEIADEEWHRQALARYCGGSQSSGAG